jgi:hypothetical protein
MRLLTPVTNRLVGYAYTSILIYYLFTCTPVLYASAKLSIEPVLNYYLLPLLTFSSDCWIVQ